MRATRRWSLVRTRRENLRGAARRVRRWLRPQGGAAEARGGRGPVRSRVVFVVLACLLGLAGWVVFATPVLGVATVEVRGAQTLGADRVRQAAAVAMGTPLARVDTAEVARRVAALPQVARVEVSRAWPHTLLIEVSERRPVAVAYAGAAYLVLDGEGVAFAIEARRPPGLVLIEVATPGPSDPATRAALRVVAALTPELRAQLRVLVAPSPVQIRLELGGGRMVLWGDAEFSEVKARVATSLLSRPGTRIDVSEPSVATVS